MKRLASLLCAAALVMATATGSFAAKTIKIAFTNLPDHPQGIAFANFKKELEERSKGAFKVDLISSGKYGNPDSIVKGLQMGVLQIGSESSSNFSVFDPRLMLFDLPFLFPSYEAADLILEGPIGKELGKGIEKNGCFLAGYMEIGFRQVFSNKPLRNLDEAKGAKLRVTPSKVHIANLAALGMNPTPMAWGEVFTGLQQGTVDGTDIDINLGMLWKFYEVTKHLTLSSHFYSPHMVLVSSRFWQGLTDDEKKLVDEILQKCIKEERKINRANEKKFLEEFKTKHGVTIYEVSPQERARWVEATKGVADQFKDSIPPAMVQEVRDTFKKAGM